MLITSSAAVPLELDIYDLHTKKDSPFSAVTAITAGIAAR